MATRFLDRYAVILLDMNSTFMFGEDRFGADEDFFRTYQQFGGKRLDRAAVNRAIRHCYAGMMRDYEDPACADNFPSLIEGLRKYAAVEDADLPLLEAVFACHEQGRVPDAHAACLQRLRLTHSLGVVSNIWAKKAPWLAEFKRVGIDALWHTTVFSSDSRSIKPSHTLFQQAVAACAAPLTDILFVGDSLRLDVTPAKAFGLTTVWITSSTNSHPHADVVVPSLLALEMLAAGHEVGASSAAL